MFTTVTKSFDPEVAARMKKRSIQHGALSKQAAVLTPRRIALSGREKHWLSGS